MRRSFDVSPDVYSAVWARWQEGDEREDDILRRILGCGPPTAAAPKTPTAATTAGAPSRHVGLRERAGVVFEDGFEIFRTYMHREYRAKADAGSWLRLDNGKRYPSVNQLNASIVAGAENVWNGSWKFRTADGKERSIDELRRG